MPRIWLVRLLTPRGPLRLVGLVGLAGLVGLVGLVGLSVPRAGIAAAGGPQSGAPTLPAAAGLAALPAAAARDACHGQRGAFLRARLRGASTLDLDWHGMTLHCDGGVRPDGQGMRVSFSGRDRAHRLLFVFGIDAAARTGSAHNIATNLTVIFEGERRIYSTRGDDRCSIDELRARALPAAQGQHRLQISARGFCIAPASALGSGAPLLVSRFDFSGAIFIDDDAAMQRSHAAGAARGSGGG